jgi:competence protein ComEC
MADRTFHTSLFSPTFVVVHLTLAFGLGILAGRPSFFGAPLVAATVALGLAALAALRLAPKLSHGLVLLFFLLIGVARGSLALTPPQADHHLARLAAEEQEVALIGVIAQAPEYGLDRTTLVVEGLHVFIPASEAGPQAATSPTLPDFRQTAGLVKLSMRGRPEAALLPGHRILTRAKIGPPQGFANPGGFDLPLFLAGQGIYTTGWIAAPQAIIRLDSAADSAHPFRYWPERLRAELITFIDQQLPREHGALYRALITGDRAGLAPARLELFRDLGILHLLAISGLHMALLAGGVIALSLWLLKRSEHILLQGAAGKIAACTAILPLLLYCMVAGFQTPALRALLMILVFISALLSDRQWHGPTTISLAALLILAMEPLALTTVSFQLSFAAVTGIILILPHTRQYFTHHDGPASIHSLRRYALGSLVVSLAASLATLPLLLFHFNRFTLSGPLATLVIEPFLCMWALAWGLPAALLVPLQPDLALLFFKIGGLGLDAALFLATHLHPVAKSIWLPTPSAVQVALYFLGLFVLIQTRDIRLRAMALACCLLLFVVFKGPPRHDQATILDVGQGNCTLIETSHGEVLVIDAGGPHTSFDIGRQVIGPALWAKGIGAIDLLVLSHPDQDHYSGAAFLLEHFAPKVLWISDHEAPDPGWRAMLATVDPRKTRIQVPQAGERHSLAAGRDLTCLTDLHLTPQKSQNNQSLVVRFSTGRHSLLMPGDIEEEGEGHLLGSQTPLESDVIIAPHHGSASSSSTAFVAQVAPRAVIFSASRYKQPHFPNQGVQARYQAMGATAWETSKSGAITLHFEAGGARVTPQKKAASTETALGSKTPKTF